MTLSERLFVASCTLGIVWFTAEWFMKASKIRALGKAAQKVPWIVWVRLLMSTILIISLLSLVIYPDPAVSK